MASENEIPNVAESNDSDSKTIVKSKPRRVRTFDPESGKSCHQCRQKTKNLTASCKVPKVKGPCSLTFCPKCLVNRYGEKIDDVEKMVNWSCPKCRGCCNCSICMKKKGFLPTGTLTCTAKAKGFASVLEFLDNKGADVLEPRSEETLPSKMSHDAENGNFKLKDGNSNVERTAKETSKKLQNDADGLKNENEEKSKVSRKVRKLKEHTIEEDIVLPAGTPLTEVAGLEFAPHDISAALHFMEFCNAFAETLDIKEGQPESVLRDLISRRDTHVGIHSALVEFNIKLLSLLKEGINENEDSWLTTMRRCIEESVCRVDDVRIDFLDNGLSGYDDLEVSEKLKLLNFLCDEVLTTNELRTTVNMVAAKFDDAVKENNEKVIAARKKEKELRQIIKDETAKYILLNKEGTQASSIEHANRISQLKSEADAAHAEVHQSLQLVPKKNQRSDAVRTDPIMRGTDGQIFWKLSSSSRILLQDVGDSDSGTLQNNWYTYNEEEEKVVEKYISSLRSRKRKRRQTTDHKEKTKLSDEVEENNSDEVEEGMELDITEELKLDDVEEGMELDTTEEGMELNTVREGTTLDVAAEAKSENAERGKESIDVEEREKSDLSSSSDDFGSGHSLSQGAGAGAGDGIKNF